VSGRGKHWGPFCFHCPKCRRTAGDVYVVRVVKAYLTKSPTRQSLNRYAYECKCGHKGTSRHSDIERRADDE